MSTNNHHTDNLADELIEELFLLEKNPAYQELLEGKTVTVVGPAQTLRGTKQGKTIDASDLVVRFNGAVQHLPFSEELAEDVGTRTDILYSNNEVLMNGILGQNRITHEQFVRITNQLGIKWIIGTNNNFSYQKAAAQTLGCYAEEEAFQRFIAEKKLQSQFNMLFSLPDLVRKWLGGYVGMTGFLALADLLRYDIARLQILGMTFYHQGGHLFPRNGVRELHPMGIRRCETSPNAEIRGHNSYFELELMKKLARHFQNKLVINAELQALLEDDSSSRTSR
jgi:hypothetical protein